MRAAIFVRLLERAARALSVQRLAPIQLADPGEGSGGVIGIVAPPRAALVVGLLVRRTGARVRDALARRGGLLAEAFHLLGVLVPVLDVAVPRAARGVGLVLGVPFAGLVDLLARVLGFARVRGGNDSAQGSCLRHLPGRLPTERATLHRDIGRGFAGAVVNAVDVNEVVAVARAALAVRLAKRAAATLPVQRLARRLCADPEAGPVGVHGGHLAVP